MRWLVIGAVSVLPSLPATPQSEKASGDELHHEWAYWGGDERSSRYSPLTQIDASTFGKLEVVWRWKAANFGPEPDPVYRATPLYANGKLYTVAGYRRTVVCIDPASGETLWMFRERDGPRWKASTRKNYGKGVAFARIGGRPIVYVATPASYLWALDADTGQPLPFFGNNGVVDLHLGLGPYSVDPDRGVLDWGDITTSAPPIVVGGVIVVGNSHDRGYYPENKENIPGIIRGYDARTGRMLWRFDPVPKAGEPFNDTWEDGSWKYTGNVSPWAPLSADSTLGLVYVPTDTPTNDYYGGSRHGRNVYGTSLLALEAKTGKLRWFYQLVHHDIWNMDLPDAPHPIDVTTADGARIPAIVQATKQGWLYVFNRETGAPVWPIEERPVPQSDVPHEKTWPTQPFVTKPPPFEQQGITENDLVDFTPALRAEALRIARQYRMGPLFSPPSLLNAPDGTHGTFLVPSSNGGANIPGGAVVDSETGWVYVASQHSCEQLSLMPARERFPDGRPWPGWGSEDGGITSLYVTDTAAGLVGPRGGPGYPPLPLVKPPYGRIVAYDLNRGDLMWQVPNGETPESVRKHPALKGVKLGNTGQNSHANLLVTKTLLMYGEGRGGEAHFRALDKKTGKELGKIELPARTTTAPMTFMHDGHQYVVVAVASPSVPAELVALALPEARPPRVAPPPDHPSERLPTKPDATR
jgi:quinoprotein glucose dehydrogenase